MARGISDLQKWMLIRALENSESELCKTKHYPLIPAFGNFRGEPARSFDPVHLTRNEIRADYYHFPVYLPQYLRNKAVDRKWLRENNRDVFRKSKIPKYNQANLAIARAHRRLTQRGLATDQIGFWLTEQGKEVAKKLMAALADNVSASTADSTVGIS